MSRRRDKILTGIIAGGLSVFLVILMTKVNTWVQTGNDRIRSSRVEEVEVIEHLEIIIAEVPVEVEVIKEVEVETLIETSYEQEQVCIETIPGMFINIYQIRFIKSIDGIVTETGEWETKLQEPSGSCFLDFQKI